MTLEINEANFEENTGEGVVVVDFFAPWCGPCRMLAPELEKLENAKVVKVDTDENRNLALKYNISSLPTVVFLKDGEEQARVVGLQNATQLQEQINQIK